VQVASFGGAVRDWTRPEPMKVQQELMRHVSIQTTMNIYGQAMSSSKREANGKVVEMVLKPVLASA
jgi:integrase